MEVYSVEVKETQNGFSYTVGPENVEFWKRKILTYFENLNDLITTTRHLKHGDQLSIKSTRAKRRDYVISMYTSGTFLIQTKKCEEWCSHWNIISGRCDVVVTDVESDNSERKSTEEEIINTNTEKEILKLLDIISAMNDRIVNLENKMGTLAEENDKLRKENEKKDMDCWEWIERRYELLKKVPNLVDENEAIKTKNLKFKQDILNVNKRVNEMEKGLKLLKDKKEDSPIIDTPATPLRSYADVLNSNTLEVKEITNIPDVPNFKTSCKEKNVLIFGDSILKYIDTGRFSNGKYSTNECIRGARIEHIEEHVKKFKGRKENSKITDILVHAGSNNLEKESEIIVINRLCSLVNTTQKIFPAATIHYSSIIPKISNSTIDICKRINSTLKIFCLQNNVSYIENTHLFVNKYGIKFERLSRYDKIHLNRSSVIAMGKHLKFHLFNVKLELKEDISPPPYSPSNSNFIVKSIPFSPFF